MTASPHLRWLSRSIAVALLISVSAGPTAQTPLASLSADLLGLLLRGDERPVRAIIRGEVAAIRLAVDRDQLPVLRQLDGLVVVAANVGQLSALRTVPGIEAISRDVPVAPMMTVSERAMAADLARQATSGLLGLGGVPAVSGRGVGVAIVDSGIAPHPALAGKVVASVGFVTGDASTGDGFGHGTHIAGIVAGSGAASAAPTLYRGGIAPDAHLVNVRVLGRNGVGYTSDVIAGLQWVEANRQRYGIRVVNLSLGHPVVEPCLTDPLCLTVERLSTAGLVVVASAGNSGKDVDGREVIASVTTPGNASQAITVGALNTWNTVTRDDDTVTTYSSRGPTKFDLRLKPDVVAPGNKILSLGVAGGTLARQFPTQVVGSGANSYFVMSGTSMAAAMVSGGAALLLQDATLTARQVKVALQLSATFLPEAGLVAGGAGSVNLWAARRVHSSPGVLIGSLPSVTIGGRTVRSTGLVTASGETLLDRLTAAVGLPILSLLGGLSPLELAFGQVASGIGQQIIWSDHDQSRGLQIIWSETLRNANGQQIIWSDGGATRGYTIIWSERSATEGSQIIWSDGTHTGGQQIIWSDTLGGHDEP